eukprot:2665611-Ditylum_brightwellii.AAC.1
MKKVKNHPAYQCLKCLQDLGQKDVLAVVMFWVDSGCALKLLRPISICRSHYYSDEKATFGCSCTA